MHRHMQDNRSMGKLLSSTSYFGSSYVLTSGAKGIDGVRMPFAPSPIAF